MSETSRHDRAKVIIPVMILAIFMLILTGCFTLASKATGGGRIPSASGVEGEWAYVAFTVKLMPESAPFESEYAVAAQGNIQLVDKAAGMKLHAVIDGMLEAGSGENEACFVGIADLNRKVTGDELLVAIRVVDSEEDYVYIGIYPADVSEPDEDDLIYETEGPLVGNITVWPLLQ